MDKQKVDARLKEMEEEITLLSGHLSNAVTERLAGTLATLDSRLDDIRASLPSKDDTDAAAPIAAELNAVRASLDAVAASLGLDGDKGASPPLAARLDDIAGSFSTGLADLGERLDKTSKNDAAAIADLGKTLRGAFDSGVSGIGKQLDAASKTADTASGELKKSLADAVAALAKKTDGIATLLSAVDGIGKRIADMSETVGKATAELPELPARLKNQLDGIDAGIGKRFDAAATGIEDAKATLMKDHDELHRSLEIIRRMCTTDEEKYLGTLITIMNDRIGKLASELPDLTGTVKQKLSVLDKNIQVAAQNTMTRQDEVKKLILYDVSAIGETASAIRGMCDTGTGASLGEEAARTGEHMARIAEDVPEVLARVNDIAAGMDRLTSQVRTMRWFVVGAVGLSLAVLALTVFL